MERHQPSGRAALGLTLAVATMLLWGVLPLALKIALRAADPYTITWFRFLLSATVLGTVLASGGRFPALHRLDGRTWGLLGVATVFLGLNYVCYLVGLDYTSAANAQVLIQLAPLLLALGGIWVFGERFTRVQWFGFAVLLTGLVAFFADQLRALAAAPTPYYLGSLMVLAAAATWAVYGMAQKQLLAWLPSQSIMLVIYGGCALLLTPLARPATLAAMGSVETAMLLFCAANTVVAYGTFSEALAHWEASRVAAVLALTPLVTLAASTAGHAIFPDWVISPRAASLGWLGASLVVAGSLGTALGGRRSPEGRAGRRWLGRRPAAGRGRSGAAGERARR